MNHKFKSYLYTYIPELFELLELSNYSKYRIIRINNLLFLLMIN